MKRYDGRSDVDLRPVRITLDYQDFADGSALIEIGNTKIICAVTTEEKIPAFLKGEAVGWVTAEYAMLPRSTQTRTPRSGSMGRIAG